jgi:hypothetical protein
VRIAAASLCLSLALPVFAAESDTLRRAFLRLEAQTETGMSYAQYGPLVAEMHTELKLLEMSKAATARPKAIRKLREAAARYDEAADLWRLQVTIASIDPGKACVSGAAQQGYKAKYPELRDFECPPITLVLKYIWRDAAQIAREGLTGL